MTGGLRLPRPAKRGGERSLFPSGSCRSGADLARHARRADHRKR